MYDLAILGGGPAGISAGVYASRKKLKTLLIAKEIGGQSIVSDNIQNWIGTPSITGAELARELENHLNTYAGDTLDIRKGEEIKEIEKISNGFRIKTNNSSFEAKTILVATGSHRRKLSVPGAQAFDNKGVSYCASCDGPLFSGMKLVVIGGGNAAFETSAQLLAYAKSVTLLNRSDKFRADEITVEKVLSHPNMKSVANADIIEIKGDNFVTSVVYKDSKTLQIFEIPVSGVFVEIGLLPTTSFVKDLVSLNEYAQIIIDPWTQRTSQSGVWAAGDCTSSKYHQNNIAAGDAVRALEDIYMYVSTM